MKKKDDRKKLLSLRFNLICGGLALICLALFVKNAIFLNFGTAGISSGIAKVTSGSLDRKRNGNLNFSNVSVGAELFNRDLLWVGPAGYAEIEFEDHTILSLRENTLLFLRRVPRHASAIPLVEVLKGKVEEKKTQRLLAKKLVEIQEQPIALPTPPPSRPPIPQGSLASPSPAPTLAPTPEPITPIHPRQNAIFGLLKKKDARIAFSWSKEFSGILVINTDSGKEVASVPIQSKKFAYVVLRGKQKYRWQLLNLKRAPVFNPVRFELRPMSKKDFQLFMRKSGNDGSLELIH